MEKKIKKNIIIILLLINLTATGGLAIYLLTGGEAQTHGETAFDDVETKEKYTLYIGTNDKETYSQLISTDKARRIVNKICTRYVEGYTSSKATGGWVDETGTLTQENTLVYSFYDVTEDQIKVVMDEVLTALNQNSILLEMTESQSTYYYGDKE